MRSESAPTVFFVPDLRTPIAATFSRDLRQICRNKRKINQDQQDSRDSPYDSPRLHMHTGNRRHPGLQWHLHQIDREANALVSCYIASNESSPAASFPQPNQRSKAALIALTSDVHRPAGRHKSLTCYQGRNVGPCPRSPISSDSGGHFRSSGTPQKNSSPPNANNKIPARCSSGSGIQRQTPHGHSPASSMPSSTHVQ